MSQPGLVNFRNRTQIEMHRTPVSYISPYSGSEGERRVADTGRHLTGIRFRMSVECSACQFRQGTAAPVANARYVFAQPALLLRGQSMKPNLPEYYSRGQSSVSQGDFLMPGPPCGCSLTFA